MVSGCRCGAGMCVWTVLLLLLVVAGCGGSGNVSAGAGGTCESVAGVVPDSIIQPAHPILRYVSAKKLPQDLVIFDSVFWEPDDTLSLRQRIVADSRLRGAAVLEAGTGFGVISLCCLQNGAARVVATYLIRRLSRMLARTVVCWGLKSGWRGVGCRGSI